MLVLIELPANYPELFISHQPAEIAFHLTGMYGGASSEVTTGHLEWCSLRNFNKRPAGGIDHSAGIQAQPHLRTEALGNATGIGSYYVCSKYTEENLEYISGIGILHQIIKKGY